MKVSYETRVAAGVLNQQAKAIRQEFDRVLGRPVRQGGRLRLGFRDVLYFQLKKELEREGINFDPSERRQLHSVLRHKSGRVGSWQRSGMHLRRAGTVSVSFDLGPIVKSSSSQLRAYYRGRQQVVRDPGICAGVPVFRGTRVPVEQVVELIRNGIALDEIREDYPGLSETALNYAALLARMEKKPGRPPKSLQLRRAVDEAAD